MPPAPQPPNTALLDDAASAVVLIEPDDFPGWEAARVKFLDDAEKAPPPVNDCLKLVAAQLTNFSSRSEEDRAAAIKEIQQLIQTVSESLWDSANLGLPKESPIEKTSPDEQKKEPVVPAKEPDLVSSPVQTPEKNLPAAAPPAPTPPKEVPVTEPVSTATPASSAPLSVPPRVSGGKFLTFFLEKEEYGFQILKVHEIITLLPITPVPRMPAHLLGVINLRGKIIPVVDLRIKLGLPPLKEQDCIIIVHAHNIEVGVTVDRVSEVANIPDSDIGEVPSFGEGVTGEDLLGIAKTGGHVRLLLDIDKVLAPDHLQGLAGQSLVTTSANGK